MAQEGVEPSRLSATDFKSVVSAVPPLGLWFVELPRIVKSDSNLDFTFELGHVRQSESE